MKPDTKERLDKLETSVEKGSHLKLNLYGYMFPDKTGNIVFSHGPDGKAIFAKKKKIMKKLAKAYRVEQKDLYFVISTIAKKE